MDLDAAEIVRRIYRLTLEGYGTSQIADQLSNEGIATPTHYYIRKNTGRGGLKSSKGPDDWNNSTVIKILSLQEYCGDVINFKTFSKSYRNKKRINNTEENMAIFRDVHQPVIERSDWEAVQAKRGQIRKRTRQNGERNIFSGMLFCADCGGNMNFHFNQKNPEIQYFNCSNNNKARKTCPATHYIRVDFLEQVVLKKIRRLTKFARQHEDAFARLI